MAEILGFYELLHSAGGRVSRVMCWARLDLNSLDIEKGETNLTGKNKEQHKGRDDYYNYWYSIQSWSSSASHSMVA